MRVVYISIIALVVILNSIELSSQSNSNFHGGPPNPGRQIPGELQPQQITPTNHGVTNEHLRSIIVLQSFIFPSWAYLKTKLPNRSYSFLEPDKQYPTLITGDGFVVARVETRTARARGIYNTDRIRVKIHHNTHEVLIMTAEERALYPVDVIYRAPPQVVLGGRYVGEPHHLRH